MTSTSTSTSTNTETFDPNNVPEWLRSLRIIDTDAHFTEPRDLWTRNAPKGYEKRLPHMEMIDGVETWVFDGQPMPSAGAGSVLRLDASRAPGVKIFGMTRDTIHPASYEWKPRVELLDRVGIWAQVLYPNIAGHGNEKFLAMSDKALCTLSNQVYNDSMFEMQEASRERLLPMAMVPWWDLKASVEEIRRTWKLGMRGVTMYSDPHESGLPDFNDPYWEPLWKVCSELGVPVHFHVGAVSSSFKRSKAAWFGSAVWPSLSDEQKLLIGSLTMFMSNARVISNFIISGLLERYPDLRIVSVESGIGWIPFFLEALEYNYADIEKPYLKMSPSDRFRRQIYTCFWFEKITPNTPFLLEICGVDRVMFETDIPHSVCLYPDIHEHIFKTYGGINPVVRRKILQDNAVALYRIQLPENVAKAA